ncbi:MAG: 50S ribosome-binding GTPase [Armatimonadetes bacterium]|nr:50S ribosome-binding GTPase [Armatimonadota bacterium]MBS1727338.1 50S ribosome-binding GTPase [Armatimonadota bacterium]
MTTVEPKTAEGGHEVLRISTAGSVDDGKSTLIGRLLFDSKAIPDDQYEAILRVSDGEDINLALLTDGLRAEREQQITIDVAYRYFSTAKRRFIIADTPGHAQYTRNMVTGASTADLALILVDARKGLLNQSRRHAVIAALLRVPRVVVAVNKMDLVGFEESVFRQIESEFRTFLAGVSDQTVDFVPISALQGDNVVERSRNMPWYGGPAILEYLETVPLEADPSHGLFRLPVQCVIRPDQNFRGFAGRITGGEISVGAEVMVARNGLRSRVRSVETADGSLTSARVGDSVILTLEDEIDVSRGDTLVRVEHSIDSTQAFEATICWMGEQPLKLDRPYIVAHSTREAAGQVRAIDYRLDIETLERVGAETLELNEIGRVAITTSRPLFLDTYQDNRATGGFILIDPAVNVPVAAGMITRTQVDVDAGLRESVVQKGLIVGLEGSVSIAVELEAHLREAGYRTVRLGADLFDGSGLDFETEVWNVAQVLSRQGAIVIVLAKGGDVQIILTDDALPEDEPGTLYARSGDVDGADLAHRLEPYLVGTG